MKRNKSKSPKSSFIAFLIKARHNTYAGNGLKTLSTRVNSYDFQYSDKSFNYHDTYFGHYSFIGEEIIYEKKMPIWGMNYYGSDLTFGKKTKKVFAFLKKSLSQSHIGIIPARGPKRYCDMGYVYVSICKGTIEKFSGQEQIRKGNKILYQCQYHGGIITGKEP